MAKTGLENAKCINFIPENPESKMKLAVFNGKGEFLGNKVDMFWNIRKDKFKFHTPEKAKDFMKNLTYDLNENPAKFDGSSEYYILALKAMSKEEFEMDDLLGYYQIQEKNGAHYIIE